MMQGTMTLYLFADDKELAILPRIASTPISVTRYLAAHGIFTFIAILLPNLAILYAIKFITGADIGFTAGEYALLFAVASALSTGFSLFLNALASKGDTANMAGSAVVTLTSVLAGSFYSFERGNPVLEEFIRILPQKAWLDAAALMEKGNSLSQSAIHLAYPLALSALFFAIAFVKTGRDYVGRK
jgi:ABC-2 type transport system permease protein